MRAQIKHQIDSATLKESEMGKVVLFYTKCPRVDQSIKRQADELISASLFLAFVRGP